MAAGLLQGKTCLITGANHGIGQAVAERFASEGAKLVLVARNQQLLDEVAGACRTKHNAECSTFAVDLTNGQALDKMCEEVNSTFGAVDVLVNNAGMGVTGTPLDGDPDAWEKMMSLNTLAPMRLTRRLSPAMVERKSGCIINIGSVAAVEPMTSSCAYAATKWGIRGWSLSCYQALRHHNVKVMLINPAFVNTPMVQGRDNLQYDRMIQPEDIAEVAMLPFRTTGGCVPEEITLRLSLSAYKQ